MKKTPFVTKQQVEEIVKKFHVFTFLSIKVMVYYNS